MTADAIGRMAPTSDPQAGDPQPLPRGRHGLPRSFVVENQRGRIFGSLAIVAGRTGYADVTVQDIVDHARVSRRTFYENFTDKEQCFVAAYDEIVERLLAAVARAYAAGVRVWPDRVSAALRELLLNCAAEPDLARLTIVDVLSAGPRALARRDATLRQFTEFFEEGRALLPRGMAHQELLAQAVVGGLYEALYGHILAGKTEELPRLMPDLLYCALVPYLGHDRALGESHRRGYRTAMP